MTRVVLRSGYLGPRKIQRPSAGGYADFADLRPAEPETGPNTGTRPAPTRRPDATDAVHWIPPYTECTAASRRRYRAFAARRVARLPATKSLGPSATGAIDMIKAKAYAAQSASTPMAPFVIERRGPGPRRRPDRDPLLRRVPFRPAHRAQRVEEHARIRPCRATRSSVAWSAVGAEVTKFKVGDIAGVGCLVDSCGHCPSCDDGLEQYCENGFVGTYNGPAFGGDNTYGGYSQTIVVKESFVLQDRDTTRSSSRRSHRCSAPASPPTRRCATGTSARARRSASSASAASATWA